MRRYAFLIVLLIIFPCTGLFADQIPGSQYLYLGGGISYFPLGAGGAADFMGLDTNLYNPAGFAVNSTHYLTLDEATKVWISVWLTPELEPGVRVPTLMETTRYASELEPGWPEGIGIAGAGADRLAYLAAGTEGLRIYSVSDPANPTLLASYLPAGSDCRRDWVDFDEVAMIPMQEVTVSWWVPPEVDRAP